MIARSGKNLFSEGKVSFQKRITLLHVFYLVPKIQEVGILPALTDFTVPVFPSLAVSNTTYIENINTSKVDSQLTL